MSTVFFGEVMLRLTPSKPQEQLIVAGPLSVDFAGAESNVASSLCRFGHRTEYVTKFPAHALGDAAMASLQKYGIGTSHILRGGERMGIYFIELGASIRPSRVIYDRAYSSISEITDNEFDWQSILAGQEWLFLGGITPALSEQCALESIKAARAAREMGVKVAFDLNFRRSLWQDASKAREYFSAIMHLADLVFANAGGLADVYEHSFDLNDPLDEAVNVGLFLHETFNVDAAITGRIHHSASKNTVMGTFLVDGKVSTSLPIEVDILDRLGTGDCFAAGILHGILKGWNADRTVDFANAAFALGHTFFGDQNWLNEREVEAAASGHQSGHIIR
ncbi:sugar kinase [Echinimonas agarilytica]|uniref:Sugar kinase n=1 Tax=Echinimonas agarilytica TaxID=1215918 RepID=A0AA41W870_9GAMM|nr:sugar kinase [Echinimonas agarilytica]MCM2680196.1 sugar kinase [Echinimonas agarilytica]